MRTLFVVGFLLVAGIPAVAQETRSTISGTVRDEQGVIPGASIKVVNTGTGVTQQLTTNSSGYFEAPLLIAGTYEVVVEMTGFKTLRRTGVTLSSGQQLALPLTLDGSRFYAGSGWFAIALIAAAAAGAFRYAASVHSEPSPRRMSTVRSPSS